MRPIAPAVVLAGALLLLSGQSAPPRLHGFGMPNTPLSEETADVRSVLVSIDYNGNQTVTDFNRRLISPEWIASCASPADLRDSHSAELPPPSRFPGVWTTRDVVVTAMNSRGRAMCARIYAVILDDGHPPRQYPLGFVAYIPVDGVAAFKISGWRGMPERTYSISELRKRLGA